MRTSIVLVGVVILVIGIALIGYGYTAGSSSTTTSTVAVVPSTSRNIDAGGIWTAGSHNLQSGQVVTGSYTVANFNNSAGSPSFLIMNESQWANWGACAPCATPTIMNKSVTGSGTFTWTAPYSGAFYFAIDDSNYGQPLSISFVSNSVQSNAITTSNNPTFVYAGVALVLVGAIILALGLIMRGTVTTPRTMSQTKKDDMTQTPGPKPTT